MSTIAGTLSGSVTLGQGSYTSPLTIAATGIVNFAGKAISGLVSSVIINYGKIIGTGNAGIGIYLSAGGSVENASLIQSVYTGVGIYNAAGTVTNSGTIDAAGPKGVGIYLSQGGDVGNVGSAALIDGVEGGVLIYGTAGAVTNAGTIASSGISSLGILLFEGGAVDNSSMGLIEGGYAGIAAYEAAGIVTNVGTIDQNGVSGIGVILHAGGTVIDAGTIISQGGTAVAFGGTVGSFLEIANGYRLGGSVVGSSSISASNTVELLGTLGNAVTADYSELHLSNFQDLLFGSGGHGTLDVDAASGTLPVTISGFNQSSDTIDLTSIGTNGTISSQTATKVTVTGSLGSVALKLDPSDGVHFTTQTDDGIGTELIACFRRGTLILTETGEVAVEELNAGDRVITLSGEAKPIRWIGRRSYLGRSVLGNTGVLPIRISAGALDDGLPARDLWVSPGHAMLLDGVLVPAEYLVNGATILQEERIEQLEYLHIELDEHAILIAEGAPSESYVDCDNRMMFANGAEHAEMFPHDERPHWAYCAPRPDWGSPELVPIRSRLVDRAAALGYPLTLDPDLHLMADGVTIAPQAIVGTCYRFAVPARSARLSLASRSMVPAEVDANSLDRRVLGVPVERISLYDAGILIEALHGHPALCDGFHADEDSHRWTDGLARLPASWAHEFSGAFALEIRLIPNGLPYRLAATSRSLAS